MSDTRCSVCGMGGTLWSFEGRLFCDRREQVERLTSRAEKAEAALKDHCEMVDGIRELAIIDRYYARDDLSEAGLPV